MKKIFLVLLILSFPFSLNFSQEIGSIAPERPLEVFPEYAWGLDVLFGESGFGAGSFFRKQLSQKLTAFADISFSEAKDEREFEYIDIFGQTFTVGKLNRIFLVPLHFGIQYRLFENVIYDNLRPYINVGIGPSLVMTTPANEEFFTAFGDATSQIAVGGYVGFGANFGLDKNNLLGLNMRYYYTHLFSDGVESLLGRPKKDIGSFFITLNLGFMY